MVRHGGCLGLGLAAMGTHRQDAYEQLKFNLYQDDANTGEAAGIAMGMVMLGSKNSLAIEDMVAVSTIGFLVSIHMFPWSMSYLLCVSTLTYHHYYTLYFN